MKKLVVYGMGQRGQNTCQILRELDSEWTVVSVLDKDDQKIGAEICGLHVEPPEAAAKYEDSFFLIAVLDIEIADQIRNKLEVILGHELRNEISYNRLILDAFENSNVIQGFLSSLNFCVHRDWSFLFCCPDGLVLGGREIWTLDICKALISSGLNNTFILTRNDVDFAYNFSLAVKEHLVFSNYTGFDVESIKEQMKIIANMLPCKVLPAFVDHMMLASHLLKRKWPNLIKIIYVVHGGHSTIYDACMDFRKCIDVYVGVSRDIEKAIIERGIDENNVYSMTCPFSCDKVLKRTYTLDYAMPIRIGFAGRFDDIGKGQKRIDLILKLIQELSDRNIKYIFDFAGDGPAKNEMEKYVYDNFHSGYVNFLGKIEHKNIIEFWKSKDICINMSDYEGRAISICEAMGSGVVPVVTDTSGVREDISDGINGFIVSLGDYMAAADRIVYLYNHRNRLPEMGKLAHDVIYPKSLMKPHVIFWRSLLLSKEIES